LTLYTTPVIYVYLDELRRRFGARTAGHRAPAVAPGLTTS